MLRELVTVDISSERDLLVIRITIEEEVASMLVGSSWVPKKKRGVQCPMSPVQKKWQTITSARPQEEVLAQTGPSTSGAEG